MKFKYGFCIVLFGLIGFAHAGTYRCDVELKDGSKDKIRLTADSEAHAARLVKESNSSVKWINCFRID